MKTRLALVIVSILTTVLAKEKLVKYDEEAAKRFDDELRRLGVQPPSRTDAKSDDSVDLSQPPIVTAPAGDFQGYWTASQFGRPIAAFDGIPYAKPPVGPLRFKVAQPSPRLDNFKATKLGSKCTQRDLFARHKAIDGQEDCLFLNVYVPEKTDRNEKELLPVMFNIPGGGFVCGQGDIYQPHILLDKDVVLVTFNYRLGPLGFLTTEDEIIPGNLGLKDQVAALRWVNENIAKFGGNPDLVTVFGHSAGGASTDHLMLSPLTKGLFHRIIAMSGSSLAPWGIATPEETRENRRAYAEHLGCPPEPSQKLLDCLQTKSAEEITGADFALQVWSKDALIPFKPVVEGNVPGALLPKHPKELLQGSPINDVPYMTGLTSEEGTFSSVGIFLNDTALQEFDEQFLDIAPSAFILREPELKAKSSIETLRKAYFSAHPLSKSQILEGSNIFTDRFFLWPMVEAQFIRRKNLKSPLYVYYFSFEGTRSFVQFMGHQESYGVCHGDDLMYLFPLPGPTKPEDHLMSLILTDIYTSFARDGVPSSPLVQTKWTPDKDSDSQIRFLHIKSPKDISMRKDLVPERWNLWKKLAEGGSKNRDEL